MGTHLLKVSIFPSHTFFLGVIGIDQYSNMQCTLGKNQDGRQEKTMYKLSHKERIALVV